jgi:chromosome segregation ATPase
MADVERWEAAALRLNSSRAEVATLNGEADRLDSESAAVEAEAQAYSAGLAAKIEAEKQVRLEEHHAASVALAAATSLASQAVEAAAAAREASQRLSAASTQRLEDLRASMASQVAAARAARDKVVQARSDLEHAQELPAIRSRQRAADARMAQLAKERTQLQQQVETLRAETEIATQGGSGARADTLEARVSQLDRECQEIQQGGTFPVGIGAGATVDVGKELASAQDCNRNLLEKVREARAARDKAQAALEAAEAQETVLHSRLQCNRRDLEDIEAQISSKREEQTLATEEVEAKRSQIAILEERAREVEEKVRRYRQSNTEACALQRQYTLARQRSEKKSTLLEWQLQNALAQLEKEKPGAPLSRCLMQSRPRERWGNGCKLRPRDRIGGSDAGSESIDADVSTTAGESVADRLLDVGHVGV